MKILLIKEPSSVDSFPPLGLMYLAAAVRKKTTHKVRIIDCPAAGISRKELIARAREYAPDLVGLTVYTSTLYNSLVVSQELKRALPSLKIVWGGPHTWWFPHESMQHSAVDFLLQGEADVTFPLFCNLLAEENPSRPSAA